MSLVPITTQALHHTQGSQNAFKFVIVHLDNITDRQASLLRECQTLLSQTVNVCPVDTRGLDFLPPIMKYFVLPYLKRDLVNKIRTNFAKSTIYLPRAIIEAHSCGRKLPIRRLALSLTMCNCKIFLVQVYGAVAQIKEKIHEMCGTLVTSYHDSELNVVITDRSDNKYATQAFEKGLSVVSIKWLEDSYVEACQEDKMLFYRDALKMTPQYRIKPFHGLFFRIEVEDPQSLLKKAIIEHDGTVIYGNEPCMTHIVRNQFNQNSGNDSHATNAKKPKIVDPGFLELCIKAGFYISRQAYQNYVDNMMAKQGHMVHRMEGNLQTNGYLKPNQVNALPPPPIPHPLRQQSDNVDAMIQIALSSLDSTQTQHTSTQMRSMPDQPLQIERSLEPSQQLYWNENVSRRS